MERKLYYNRLERERKRRYRRKVNRIMSEINAFLLLWCFTLVLVSVILFINSFKKETTIEMTYDERNYGVKYYSMSINDIEEQFVTDIRPQVYHIQEMSYVALSMQPEYHFYDVPLSEDIQTYIYETIEIYDNVPVELVFALIEKESGFDSNARSKTHDSGLMQINDCNLETLEELFGITDIYDPEQNILGGIYILSTCMKVADGDLNKALMCYNMGCKGARNLWLQGIYSSSYSREVLSYYENYLDK